MQYISTRGGGGEPLRFSDAVMAGLARDGGLLLPASIPSFADRLSALQGLSFQDLAYEIMRPYVDLTDEDLARLVRVSYAGFRSPDVTPIVRVGDVSVLELFHGPTLAFKDIALQFLGNVFAHLLAQRDETLNILAATSGDTGSAAIYGVRGKPGIQIFVLHPKGRTSPMQERQMTAVRDRNVHNLAVEGTFDDCQAIVKQLFADLPFRDQYCLGAVNSINWARVLAQITYYAYASLRVTAEQGVERVRFSVPTGNFGDIFAGYLAVRMGFPISKLVLATNENDILARFFTSGVYETRGVLPTISPSMDIQVASNFERYLYYCAEADGAQVAAWMAAFKAHGRIEPGCTHPADEAAVIVAGTAHRQDTLDTIRAVYRRHGYLLDPHTAVGVHASRIWHTPAEPMICLATAHPAKFPDAIREALGEDIARHPILDQLAGGPTRCREMPADAGMVKHLIAATTDQEAP